MRGGKQQVPAKLTRLKQRFVTCRKTNSGRRIFDKLLERRRETGGAVRSLPNGQSACARLLRARETRRGSEDGTRFKGKPVIGVIGDRPRGRHCPSNRPE